MLVTGNLRTSDELIRREIALQPGEPLGEDAMLESQRRLAALGLFRRVRIVELPHGAGDESRRAGRGRGGAGDHGLRTAAVSRRDAACGWREDGARPRSGSRWRRAASFEISRRNLWGKNRS